MTIGTLIDLLQAIRLRSGDQIDVSVEVGYIADFGDGDRTYYANSDVDGINLSETFPDGIQKVLLTGLDVR